MYKKTIWCDQNVQRPKTYKISDNDDGSSTLLEDFGEVTDLGTPVNALNMNHIEEGIAACDVRKYDEKETYEKGEWVTGIIDGKKGLYESLVSENVNNELESKQHWKKVEFGSNASGYSLFDLIQKDHILSYEEKEGLERLGEYVYKEAQDGRYGYPDFYDKCMEEYNDGGNTKENLHISSNIQAIGGIVDTKGILSNFSTNNYASINKIFEPDDATKNWEIVLKIKTPSSISSNYISILGSGASTQKYGIVLNISQTNNLVLYVSGDSTSWSIASALNSTNTLEPEKEYLIKISYKYENVTDELNTAKAIYSVDAANITKDMPYIEWKNYIKKEIDITLQTQENTYKAASFTPSIGIDYTHPFTNGEIDLNQSYIKIDDETFWQGAETVKVAINKNGHKYYSTKQAKGYIDEIYNNTGVAWFYGIDEENKRILLPRNDYFFQNTNSKNIGDNISAGLPNITGQTGATSIGNRIPTTGAFAYNNRLGSYTYGASNAAGGDVVYMDASRSSSIYGNSETVQPPSVCVAIYMVVGNTQAVKKASLDAVDVTTSNNDTLPLFTGMYYDFSPNHISWIKAGTTVNADMYVSAYNELVKISSGEETKYGADFKIVEENLKVEDRDYSEYWILNQEKRTFRAPLKLGFFMINTDKIPVVGNGKAITINNGADNYPIAVGNYSSNAVIVPWHDTSLLGHSVGETISGANSLTTNNLAGLTTNPDLSGLVADLTNSKQSDAQLYFKVGNAVENLELIDAGNVFEVLNGKIDKCDPVYLYGDGDSTILFDNAELGIHIIDLTPIIPDDGHSYDLHIDITSRINDTSSNNRNIDIYDETCTKQLFRVIRDGQSTGGSASDLTSVGTIQLASYMRKIAVKISGTNNQTFVSVTIRLNGYRKF